MCGNVARALAQVRAFCIKFLMTVVNYAIGWGKMQDVLLLMCSLYLTWVYLKWVSVAARQTAERRRWSNAVGSARRRQPQLFSLILHALRLAP